MADDTMRTLIVSLGPVQGFVAQARRTRDLWAGSFLLSWLTGQAMSAVVSGGGRIVIPNVEADPMFLAITDPKEDRTPGIGSLPNLFTARVPTDFDPQTCRTAVLDAWTKLGEAVWTAYVAPVATAASGGETALQALWDAQMAGFWDVVWVMAPSTADATTGKTAADVGPPHARHWLAMRKAWRSHLPPDETTVPGREQGGDHCQMMGDWLEVSGYVRSIPDEKQRQADFWEALRNTTKTNQTDSDTLELAEGERLSAIALVKRLFPILDKATLKETIGWVPAGSRDRIRQWPSTRAMAAVPWLMEAETYKDPAEAFARAVSEHAPLYRNTVAERNAYLHLGRTFGALGELDGGLFFRTALENPRDFAIKTKSRDHTEAEGIRKALLCAHDALMDAIPITPPSPYYAILLMDGDSAGSLIQDTDACGPDAASALFAAFTQQVPDIVQKHVGACIYAGGDDVLAMLPLTSVLDCARDLREAYREAARCTATAHHKPALGERGTISAAIIIAEATVPLRLVLERAHKGLDARAKDLNGRDSLSLEILKPGGMARDWVSAWDSPAVAALSELLGTLANAGASALSTRFLYVLVTRYANAVLPLFGTRDGAIDENALSAILIKEYKDNTAVRGLDPAEITARVRAFLAACQEQPGGQQATRIRKNERPMINADTGPILRFLAEQWPRPVRSDSDTAAGEVEHG